MSNVIEELKVKLGKNNEKIVQNNEKLARLKEIISKKETERKKSFFEHFMNLSDEELKILIAEREKRNL